MSHFLFPVIYSLSPSLNQVFYHTHYKPMYSKYILKTTLLIVFLKETQSTHAGWDCSVQLNCLKNDIPELSDISWFSGYKIDCLNLWYSYLSATQFDSMILKKKQFILKGSTATLKSQWEVLRFGTVESTLSGRWCSFRVCAYSMYVWQQLTTSWQLDDLESICCCFLSKAWQVTELFPTLRIE